MDGNDHQAADRAWDDELVALLAELSEVQEATLEFLTEKRDLLARGDLEGLSRHDHRAADVIGRLEAIYERRQRLLVQAAEEGLPAQNLRRLSSALDGSQRHRVSPILSKASHQARLLRHHSLTNWVLAQRHLIHVSSLIEILATGGRLQPTYGKGAAATSSGALVDRAA